MGLQKPLRKKHMPRMWPPQSRLNPQQAKTEPTAVLRSRGTALNCLKDWAVTPATSPTSKPSAGVAKNKTEARKATTHSDQTRKATKNILGTRHRKHIDMKKRVAWEVPLAPPHTNATQVRQASSVRTMATPACDDRDRSKVTLPETPAPGRRESIGDVLWPPDPPGDE